MVINPNNNNTTVERADESNSIGGNNENNESDRIYGVNPIVNQYLNDYASDTILIY